MGSIKDRNGMDLAEAEDIKKRWQEYTEELYKKDLHDEASLSVCFIKTYSHIPLAVEMTQSGCSAGFTESVS